MAPRKVLGTLGIVLVVLALFMATALPWAWFDAHDAGQEVWPSLKPWLSGIILTAGPGLILGIWGRKRGGHQGALQSIAPLSSDRELSRREALVVVTLSWVFCGIFGGIPFLLDGMVDTPIDALFETVSGVTTTGSTILTDIEAQSRASLWWRALLQWLGGMGIIVFFLAIFPQAGGGGRKLFEGEVPGPEKELLRPRIAETSAVLWRIYGGLTLLAACLYMLEGMSFHDAVCHAFTTLATGGFSTKSASIAAFESPLIEATVTAFMILGGINFALYFSMLRRRSLKVLVDTEFLVYCGGGLLVILVMTISLVPTYSGDLLTAFRHGAFQAVAIATSTGYASADFVLWPVFSQVLLLCLMFVGGMAGSTSGGFKLSRVIILVGSLLQELRRNIHPRAVFTTRVGKKPVQEKIVRNVLSLCSLALLTLGLGTLAMTCLGVPLAEAFSATLTAFSNGGPGLASIGPAGSFAALPAAAKGLLAALMIVGRLEFFTALALLTPGLWTGK
ncbi:MAG: TrkH family potassium uptake protein [Myxococcota bacterium]|nr:TrkH family potassium uptake protein [Myxococcota bacterium]